jgi:hypothetical protein
MSTSEITLKQFAGLVANLYRAYPDECVITLGDWQPSPAADRSPIFHGTIRVTVGDFRRWQAPGQGTGDKQGEGKMQFSVSAED